MAVARLVTLLGNAGDPITYTVDETIAVPKGTIMKISASPQTAAAATTDGEFVCGIASVEVVANVGTTTLAVWTHGVFELDTKAGEAMTLGKGIKIDGANTVAVADSDTIETAGECFGRALETVGAAAAGDVLINIG